MPNITRERTKRHDVVRMSMLQAGLAAFVAAALLCVPAAADAQLTKQEQKCIGKLTKDGGKLSKTEGKLQQKCLKDAAKGKLTGTADQCVADDERGKIAKFEQKTLDDETKHCFDGTGFVTATGAQTNISGKAQALELARDLLGSTLNSALQTEKANIKCQQKVQKALDKVLATKIKSYTKCAKLAAKEETTTNLAPFENCLIAVVSDTKVQKLITKLNETVDKVCTDLEPTLDTIFPGDCNLTNLTNFKTCTDTLAECRACTTIAGMNGLATDCDLFDNGLDDDSCADAAPACGDGNVDPGEECDPGAEPTCCSSTCTNNSNGISCDDGVFCNGADTCQSGACVSPGDPCLGGSECNVTCNEATDDCFDPAATPCTDDGNVCSDDVCDGAGTCSHPDNTDPCDDGNACTTVDVCGSGTCNGSVPPDCSDGNVCTDDVCIPATGCDNPPNTDPCDDGVFCNGADTCDGAGGCTVNAGNPCPGQDVGPDCSDSCNEGADDCTAPDVAATSCDDGLFCTVTDTCDGGGSCIGTGNPCPGQDVGPNCADSCNEGADDCTAPDAAATSCDDGLFCTVTDTCDGGGTCVGASNPCPGHDVGPDCDDSCNEGADDCTAPDAAATTCDDGLFCTATDTCDGGGTCNGVGDPCSAGGECADSCNEGADNCFDAGGTACTDDGNVCTDDQCDGAGSCAHPNNTDPCDDGAFCNGTDTCSGGSCSVHTGDPCSGGSECNTVCNEGPDTCFDASGTTCTDDGNGCTDDECNGAGACSHPNNSAPCDDANACTFGDSCTGGICSPGTPYNCNDSNVCTDDSCDGVGGCLYVNNTDPCDSGVVGPNDNCDVTGDVCSGGVCVNTDPAQVPEQCYTPGDEDCDGFADTADTDADSECQANGIQTCTCADACEVGRVIPAASGSTSLAGLTDLTGEGSVSTVISNATSYGTTTRTGIAYTFSGVPANLDLWWSWTGNAGQTPENGNGNITQFRFAAGESDAQTAANRINEGPHTGVAAAATVVEFSRADGLPIAFNNGCSSSTATSLEVRKFGSAGSFTTWGSPFPTSALVPASVQSDVTTNLTTSRILPVTGNFNVDYNLQLGGSAIDPLYDACSTSGGTWGYGINLQAALYGSFRNANVCP